MENLNKQRRNFISLSEGGFAYIWQNKWVEIIAIKTEGTQIHFLSDVLVAVASLDLKVPNNSMCSCWSFYSFLFWLSNCLKAHNTCTNITCKQKKYSVCYLVYIAFIKFIVMEHVQLRLTYTVNSLYSGHGRDLKLVSSVARVRNSGSLF